MGNLKPISRKELIRKLKKLGFEGPYIGGKHEYLKKGNYKITIPNIHSGKELGKPIIAQICKEIGIETKKFMDL